MQAITTGDEKSPNMLQNIGKAIVSFFLSIGFAIFCFFVILVLHIASSLPAHMEFWWGGLIAAALLVLSIIGNIQANYTVQKKFLKNDMQYWSPLDTFDHLEHGWGWWAIFGPTFLSLLATSFVFFPMKESVTLINGKVMTSYTIVNPWKNSVIAVTRERTASVDSWETTKDGIAVRGTVSADFVLGDDPSLWISDDNLKAKAEDELKRRFEATVAKMDARDLIHWVIIEAGVADERLSKVGLEWKPGSVIKISNVHAALPES
ncbi:MAG: hypothetical protein WC761_03025 [Candidatus Paceibacterota bacterium]|jgi:hypothetical protein